MLDACACGYRRLTDYFPGKKGLSIHSLIYSFTESHNKYLPGSWYMPGTILSAKDTEAYILPVVKQTRNT